MVLHHLNVSSTANQRKQFRSNNADFIAIKIIEYVDNLSYVLLNFLASCNSQKQTAIYRVERWKFKQQR